MADERSIKSAQAQYHRYQADLERITGERAQSAWEMEMQLNRFKREVIENKDPGFEAVREQWLPWIETGLEAIRSVGVLIGGSRIGRGKVGPIIGETSYQPTPRSDRDYDRNRSLIETAEKLADDWKRENRGKK